MRVLLVSEGKHEESGALETLVKRVASCDWDRANSNRVQVQPGKGQRFSKRAIAWIRHAQKLGYDALVLVIDEDSDRERIRAIDSAQEENAISFPRALGIAIHAFDAWMLADEKALASVLGMNVPTQPAPEDNRNPKSVCASLLGQSKYGLWKREMYAKIAEVVDVVRLQERCPKGFGVFAARLRSL